MSDLVDLHCHLLAGLDDGPRSWDDSLAMCRLMAEQGVRHVAALAHQCHRWNVQAGAIREAVGELRRLLVAERIGLSVHPTAEVMAAPDLIANWSAGRLVSIGDHGKHLLVEMPNGLFVDLRPTVRRLGQLGVRMVLAHPELHPELLHERGAIEELIHLGCLVQVSSRSITDPGGKESARALRSWVRRGCVHFLGSDGHSPRKRRPLLLAAFERLRDWAGEEAARRIAFENGARVLRGEAVNAAPPRAERRWWAAIRLW